MVVTAKTFEVTVNLPGIGPEKRKYWHAMVAGSGARPGIGKTADDAILSAITRHQDFQDRMEG